MLRTDVELKKLKREFSWSMFSDDESVPYKRKFGFEDRRFTLRVVTPFCDPEDQWQFYIDPFPPKEILDIELEPELTIRDVLWAIWPVSRRRIEEIISKIELNIRTLTLPNVSDLFAQEEPPRGCVN